MSDIIYLTDRSAAETDDTCGMKFYWNRKHNGIGMVPKEDQLALRLGAELHEDMAELAFAEDPQAWLTAKVQHEVASLKSGKELEYQYRRLGWLAGWVHFVEPGIRARYQDIGIERELALDRTPLVVAVTPDRVLRDRQDGSLVYFEYKSTISASQKWLSSWNYMIQLHIGMQAIAEELNEPVKFAQIIGFMKGQEREGLLNHPYVYAYRRGDEWTDDYNKARSAGWEKAGVWDYPGGIEAWVLQCGADVARQQFPFTAPVFLNLKMLDEWVARRTHREEVVSNYFAYGGESVPGRRGLTFEKRTSKCRPAWGDACPYIRACWNASVEQDPLASGEFLKRVPHHDLEMTWELD